MKKYLTTYNLYIKKMKKYLKIWLGGRPYSFNACSVPVNTLPLLLNVSSLVDGILRLFILC